MTPSTFASNILTGDHPWVAVQEEQVVVSQHHRYYGQLSCQLLRVSASDPQKPVNSFSKIIQALVEFYLGSLAFVAFNNT